MGQNKLHDVRFISEGFILPHTGLQCGNGENLISAMVWSRGPDCHSRGSSIQIHDRGGERDSLWLKTRKSLESVIRDS